MRKRTYLRFIIFGSWAPPKPRRKRGFKRRFNFADQSRAVQYLITTGHFNDPADAQAFLNLHQATDAHQVEHFLPPLHRHQSLRRRLHTFLLYLLGEYECDNVILEKHRLKSARARSRHQVRLRTTVVHRPRDRLLPCPNFPRFSDLSFTGFA